MKKGAMCLCLCLVSLALAGAATAFGQDLATEKDPAKLAAVLRSPQSSEFDKALACKRLAVVGTGAEVPVLAELLLDPKFSHYARYALEPIPSSIVDEALRQAVARAEGPVRLGILNSIGSRRDAKAIPLLTGLLSHADPAVVDAAASALGRIGTAEAMGALGKALKSDQPAVRRAAGDALLICGEKLNQASQTEAAIQAFDMVRTAEVPLAMRLAAMRGAVLMRGANGVDLWKELLNAKEPEIFALAMKLAREIKSTEVDKILAGSLAQASPDRAVMILAALADVGGDTALAAIRKAAAEGQIEVRTAALKALAQCGDVSSVGLLLDAALSSDAALSTAGKDALLNFAGQGVNAALVEYLNRADKAGKLILLTVVSQRRIIQAAEAVRTLSKSDDQELRLAAVRTLGNLGQDRDIAVLAEGLIQAKTADEEAAFTDALKAVCQRVADRPAAAKVLREALSRATGNRRGIILEVLGTLGGKEALAIVAEAARSPDPELQDAATAVLGNWLSPDVAPVIWQLLQDNAADRFRVRLIRAYVRVARQFSVSEEERLAMCRNTLQIADRPEERRLVLDVLRRNPSAQGLVLAAGELDRPGMVAPACEAVVTIAEKLGKDTPGMRAILQRVLEVAKDPQVKARVQNLLSQLP